MRLEDVQSDGFSEEGFCGLPRNTPVGLTVLCFIPGCECLPWLSEPGPGHYSPGQDLQMAPWQLLASPAFGAV